MAKARDVWANFDSIFEGFFGDKPARREERKAYVAKRFDDRHTIAVEVPGCGPEDVSVTHDGEVLTVAWTGGRKGEMRFTVPEGTDLAAVSATVEKGVATVTLPLLREKPAERKVVRVPVK